MKIILSTILITAASFMTVPASAEPALIGDMQKLQIFDREQLMPELIMDGVDDKRHFLSDYAGQIVLVNLWATWCPPCVEELASLDQLEIDMGGDNFKVLAVSMDDNMTPTDIEAFLKEEGVTSLQTLVDHDGSTSKIPNLYGLPTSFIVNDVGNTVAVYEGDADWASPESKAVIQHFVDQVKKKYGRDLEE